MAVCDGKEFGPFDWAAGFTWSPDGKTAAWAGMKDWGETLIYVGKKSFGEVSLRRTSSDSDTS